MNMALSRCIPFFIIFFLFSLSELKSPFRNYLSNINQFKQSKSFYCTARQCWPIGQFGECSIINLLLSVLRKYLLVSSVFLFFPLVTISQQASYDAGIHRKNNGIIRVFIGHHQSVNLVLLRYPSSRLRNHTRFVDWVTLWIVLMPERTKTGGLSIARTRLCGPCTAAIVGSIFPLSNHYSIY